MNDAAPLLKVRDLRVHFATEGSLVRAVDGVDLELLAGETLALVGESGCGKSTLARALVGLNPITSGSAELNGRTITGLTRAAARPFRRELQLVFQYPYASLNPRFTIAQTLAEPLLLHGKASRSNVDAKVSELLAQVGLDPELRARYPHEFSGGQRQRIAIARALAVEPKLIIADEPVSALDVSIQAQIINLLAKLSHEMGLTLIFISHDLSVVRHISDRIAVMYLGKIVELGAANEVFERPLHPYTRALVSAVPIPDPAREKLRQRILLAGDPPSPLNPPGGCAFHPRCSYAVAACSAQEPPLENVGATRQAACLRVKEIN
jgi:oligopeptide transport system ATP-binding protein